MSTARMRAFRTASACASGPQSNFVKRRSTATELPAAPTPAEAPATTTSTTRPLRTVLPGGAASANSAATAEAATAQCCSA